MKTANIAICVSICVGLMFMATLCVEAAERA